MPLQVDALHSMRWIKGALHSVSVGLQVGLASPAPWSGSEPAPLALLAVDELTLQIVASSCIASQCCKELVNHLYVHATPWNKSCHAARLFCIQPPLLRMRHHIICFGKELELHRPVAHGLQALACFLRGCVPQIIQPRPTAAESLQSHFQAVAAAEQCKTHAC